MTIAIIVIKNHRLPKVTGKQQGSCGPALSIAKYKLDVRSAPHWSKLQELFTTKNHSWAVSYRLLSAKQRSSHKLWHSILMVTLCWWAGLRKLSLSIWCFIYIHTCSDIIAMNLHYPSPILTFEPLPLIKQWWQRNGRLSRATLYRATHTIKGTRCLGSDELVYEKRLKPFVMKCIWLERCFKSRT